MIIEEEEYLEHFGKKGMKWGQRKAARVSQRKAKGEARVARLKAGKGSLKDKLIRDLDIGGTNTAVRGPASGKKKAASAVIGVGLLANGVYHINKVLKETGHKHLGA